MCICQVLCICQNRLYVVKYKGSRSVSVSKRVYFFTVVILIDILVFSSFEWKVTSSGAKTAVISFKDLMLDRPNFIEIWDHCLEF